MALNILTNTGALKSQNCLNTNTNALQKATTRLSTGLRINSAKDDAAGLAISETFTSQIRSMEQVLRNIQDGVNFINTAEGGMQTVTEDLTRIRELCLQAANEIYDDEKKQAILNEVKQRLANIDVSSETTQFAGKTLLNGSVTSLTLQSGIGSDKDVNTIDIGPMLSNVHTSSGALDVFLDIANLGSASGGQIDASNWSGDDIRAYIEKLDLAINKITFARAELGAISNRLEANSQNITNIKENITQARSSIRDADIAAESSEYAKYQILQQTSASMLVQNNRLPQLALSLMGGN